MNEPTLQQLKDQAARLRDAGNSLWATHLKLHEELKATYETIQRTHFMPPQSPGPPPQVSPPEPPAV